MPHNIKYRNSFLYTFIVAQLVLNVTFTNAAVIRREKREISANVTGIATSNNELDSGIVTTEANVGSTLTEASSNGSGITTGISVADVTTTDVSKGKKETTTLTGSTIDENTVSFALDDEEIHSEGKEEANQNEEKSINRDQNTTIELQSKDSKSVLNEETSTVHETLTQSENEGITTTELLPVVKEDNFAKGEDVLQSTVENEEIQNSSEYKSTLIEDLSTTQSAVKPDETTPQVTFDSSTISTDVEQDDTTSLKKAIEGTTMSTVRPDEATNISTVKEPGEMSTPESTVDISTTFMTGERNQSLADEVIPLSSTPLSDNDQILTDRSWTSTVNSDESFDFLTSTETSDDNPTTFFANSQVNKEIKNSSGSSAEKRGKFIDENYSSANELRLPNNSDAWALAGMKSTGKVKSSELQNSVETSDEKALNNSMVTKNLLDWTRVMMSTSAMDADTTVKSSDTTESTTTEAPVVKTTTEMQILQENQVEILSTISPKDLTTEVVNLTDKIGIPENKNEVDPKIPPKFETTTNLDQGETTPERFTMNDSSLPENDDVLSTTQSSLNLLKGRDDAFIDDNRVEGDSLEEEKSILLTNVTTTTTIIPNIVTMKSETTNSPVTGETTEEQNTGTISTSTLSLIDFTTSMPFLTTTQLTATTTQMASTIAPPIIFNMDDRTNEPPNMEATLIPSQSSPAAILESKTITTTTTTPTTITAVTVMAATTETQTTEANTPAIISSSTSDDTMTQKSNNYNNYEVVNKTTTKFAENSSIEASEASTRVLPNWVEAVSATTTQTYTTEVDRLDDFDVTTVSSFDSNNAFEIATSEPSSTTVASILTVAPTIIAITTTSTTEDLVDHIDSIQKISDTAETALESNVIDPLQVGEASTTTTSTTTTPSPPTTESSQENMRMQSTGSGGVDSSSTTTTTVRYDDDSMTTLQSISTKKEDVYSIVPTIDNGFHVPKLVVDDVTTTSVAGVLSAGAGQPMDQPDGQETDVNVIIAISVSVVGIVALILLVAFLYVMRKRQKQMSYGQRCRPVSLDAYSLDNVSVYNSVRRKGAALRASKRSYGNVAFDDPSLRHNVLGTHELAKYVEKKSSIWEEFKDVPQIIARADEVPAGCEDKNRYANVIPLPETRVILQQQNGDEKSEYINANYVRGPKDTANYYIACQAPLETTVTDFWRMIWEQNSRVIIMATDLIENGIDKCAEYLPPSVTLDNHTVFGDFQVTLKNREVKEKYAISTLMLKNTVTEESREITHYWYQWPEAGVPTDEAAIIAMLLEARSSLKLYTIEQSDNKIDTILTDEKPIAKSEINGNVATEKQKPLPKDQGPLTIHCSPGTGRTGTILACDIAMRCLEEPKRCVDIPQIVYSVRRGRASAVQTKEQYEFIYKVTHMYATKISNLNNDN